MKKLKKRGGGKAGAGARPRKLSPGAVLAAAAVLLAALGVFAVLASRPQYVWYVEEGLEPAWNRVINAAGSPKNFKGELAVLRPGETPPNKPGGFIITTHREKTGAPLTIYPRLSFTLEYEGAHVLALDPWMVFRSHRFPPLTRSRIEAAGGGEGILLLPGRDPASIRAWTARLVQEAPGVFPPDQAV
jgi:hypothetical protein